MGLKRKSKGAVELRGSALAVTSRGWLTPIIAGGSGSVARPGGNLKSFGSRHRRRASAMSEVSNNDRHPASNGQVHTNGNRSSARKSIGLLELAPRQDVGLRLYPRVPNNSLKPTPNRGHSAKKVGW